MGQRNQRTAKPKGGQLPGQMPPPATQSPVLDAGAAAASTEVSLTSLQQLEDKRKRLCSQLKDVERQIYDLETRYLEGCNPNANALTGYESLRTSLGSSKPAKTSTVVPEDRIFSGSSTTTLRRTQ